MDSSQSTPHEQSDFSLTLNYSGYNSNNQDLQKINDETTADHTNNYEARYLSTSTEANRVKKVHFIFGLYPQEASTYVAAPEIYFSNIKFIPEYTSQFEYTLGRRKTIKNNLDDIFNLGVLNPYFTQDHIHFTPQGLTGFHGVFQSQDLKLGAHFYPLFVPNQGPASLEKNGKIVGVNRWSQSVPKTFVYNNKENNIDYAISDYNLYSLMNHPGYSLTFQAGDIDQSSIEFNTTFTESPLNDIVISRTIVADLNLNGSVEIFPVVRYSQKISSDFKFKKNNTIFFISYLMDKPDNKLENDERAVQFMDSIYGYGTGIQVDMSEFVHRGFKADLAYAKFFGGEIRDISSSGEENAFSISNNRLIYQNPFKASLELEGFRMLSNSVFFKANWIYDSFQKGSLFSFQAQHSPMNNLNIQMGVDIVGVVDENETRESKKSFLSRHAADDRFTGAIQYAF